MRAPSLAQRFMLRDAMTYLPDDLLVKVDRASMHVGLEVRAPLLDHRIAEFAWSLPPALLFADGNGKRVLREALYRRVPRALVDRPKHGFEPPLARWLREGLRDWADDLLSAGAARGARFRRAGDYCRALERAPRRPAQLEPRAVAGADARGVVRAGWLRRLAPRNDRHACRC